MKRQTNKKIPILVLEDREQKWLEVRDIIMEVLPHRCTITRAETLIDGERKLKETAWGAYVLDVSMDIAKSDLRPTKGGHATLGGLQFARQIFMRSKEAPTIILTAFDAFPSGSSSGAHTEIVGLDEIRLEAKEILGDNLIDCVRYGQDGWQVKFREALERASAK